MAKLGSRGDGRSRSCRVRLRGAAGETLIESLVTVALVSIVLMSTIYFVSTLLTVTRARAETVTLANESVVAAEAIKSLAYVPCGTPAAYNAVLVTQYTPPAHYSAAITVTGVEYLSANPSGATTTSGAAVSGFGSSCTVNPATNTDFGAQRVLVRVAQLQSGHLTNLVFIKRDNRCTGLAGAITGQRC